jgi:hypothetical protein
MSADRQPSLKDRREAARLKTRVEIWLDPGGFSPAIACHLADISNSGARIECDVADLPEEFILAVGEVKHVARVVWRRQKLIGVAFKKETQQRRVV